MCENEKCKNCEHHESYRKECVKNDIYSAVMCIIVSVLILLGSGLYLKYATRPTIEINGHRVEVEDDSLASYLVDSGYCTYDDIQELVDSVASQTY